MKARRTAEVRDPGSAEGVRRVREEGGRRGGLIRATGRLFREKGFDATTVRDIAGAVGMRSGSPFYHFKSKQEMLKAVMLEGLGEAQARLEEAAAHKGTPRRRLLAMVRVHLQAILGPGADFVPVLLYDWRSLPGEYRVEVLQARDRYEAVWDRELKALQAAGLVRDGGSLTRLLVLGALNWIVQWYRPDGKLSVEAIAGRVVTLVLGPERAAPRRRA